MYEATLYRYVVLHHIVVVVNYIVMWLCNIIPVYSCGSILYSVVLHCVGVWFYIMIGVWFYII